MRCSFFFFFFADSRFHVLCVCVFVFVFMSVFAFFFPPLSYLEGKRAVFTQVVCVLAYMSVP